jgi:hypothetical protein
MALENWLPFYFRTKVINIMAFLLIHSPTKANPNATLEETFFGKQPNLRILNFFGCVIYVHVQKEN